MSKKRVYDIIKSAYDLSAVEMLVLYWYNTNPDTIMRTLFPDAVDLYIAEKVGMYKSGFVHFWGVLDWEHRAVLIAAAKSKYAEEAQRNVHDYIMTLSAQTVMPTPVPN